MLIILHVEIDLISKYKYINLEMKDYYVPYTLLPQYKRECTELYFFFLVCTWVKLNLKKIIFQLMEHQQPIINQYILQ
jgi:hypothetical protein